jgi:hypothetical protein
MRQTAPNDAGGAGCAGSAGRVPHSRRPQRGAQRGRRVTREGSATNDPNFVDLLPPGCSPQHRRTRTPGAAPTPLAPHVLTRGARSSRGPAPPRPMAPWRQPCGHVRHRSSPTTGSGGRRLEGSANTRPHDRANARPCELTTAFAESTVCVESPCTYWRSRHKLQFRRGARDERSRGRRTRHKLHFRRVTRHTQHFGRVNSRWANTRSHSCFGDDSPQGVSKATNS